MNDSLQLFQYPGDIVRLFCGKSGQSGQHRKLTLIDRYGTDIGLPDLREEIAQFVSRLTDGTKSPGLAYHE